MMEVVQSNQMAGWLPWGLVPYSALSTGYGQISLEE